MVKSGKISRVKKGANVVAELGVWSLDGMTTETIEHDCFEDDFKHYLFGIGDFGAISFSGNYDPDDTDGQVAVESAWKEKTLVTDLYFFIDNTSYWAADLTNDSSSGILITSYGAVTFEKSAVGKVAFSAKVTGQMVLV